MIASDLPLTVLPAAADWEPWIGYIRVSTWREEKISPDIQRAAIEAWALRTHRRIIAWVVDLDMTGRNFKRKVMRAVEATERREARGIAVWRYSRFGRNSLGVRINLARLERAGGQLLSATEPVDATTAVGEFERDIHIALAAFESNRAGEGWRDTHAVRIQAGVPATGRQRFGYLWTPRRVPDPTSPTGVRLQPEGYRLHPDHAPIMDELYERKVEDHDGFNGLTHWVNDELLIPTSRGGPWGVSTMSRMLDSGFAAGLLHIHDPECRCPYRTAPADERPPRCTEGRMIYVPGAHPAVISPDRWRAYLEHRAQTKATPPRARRATYPLTGLLRHGACRHHLSACSDTIGGIQVRGHAYACSHHKHVSARAEAGGCPRGIHVTRARVEADVRAWLAEQIGPEVGVILGRIAEERVPAVPDTGRLTAELATLDAALTRAADSHARGIYDDDTYITTRDRLRAERASVAGQLASMTDVSALPTRESLRPAMARLVKIWDGLTPIEANAILRRAVHRVVVHDLRAEGSRWVDVRIEVHPMWEPDPWASSSPPRPSPL